MTKVFLAIRRSLQTALRNVPQDARANRSEARSLMERAGVSAGVDARGAQDLRRAAVAQLSVVR